MISIKASEILKPRNKNHHARIRAELLPDLLMDIEKQTSIPIRLALKLILLTYVRTMELIDARWDEFDFKEKVWRIPSERSKMKDGHFVPLSNQAIEVLNELQCLCELDEKWEKTGRLFKWEGGGRRNIILNALYSMGYKGRMTGHGFRAVASTILHEHDHSHQHIELQLAHKERSSSSAAYNDAQYIEQRRVLMQAWADYIDQIKFGGSV
jgi:integrase